MNEVSQKVPSPPPAWSARLQVGPAAEHTISLVAQTPQVPTTSGHPLVSCRASQRGLTARLGSSEGVHSSGPCSVLRGGLGRNIPPWEPSQLMAVALSPPPSSWRMTRHHQLHPLEQPKKDLRLAGWGLWLTRVHTHTHTRTPCTDGESARRVPLSIRSCLKSLSCTQPESQADSAQEVEPCVLTYVCLQRPCLGRAYAVPPGFEMV